MANQAVLRVTKDIRDVKNGGELSLAVAFRDSDVRRVRAMIIGPPETPYEFGFFEFDFKFPNNYPTSAPTVRSLTTDGSKTRFNPNIYADGKVCLSILGTWPGEKGEDWSTVQSLESVLLSIQSLMSSNPYENEPGFEKPTGRANGTPTANAGPASLADGANNANLEDDGDVAYSPFLRRSHDEVAAKQYAAKIQHETINISVLKRLERYLGFEGPVRRESEALAEAFGGDEVRDEVFEPFVDLCKRRFLWYYHSYVKTLEGVEKKKNGTPFQMTPFESHTNWMGGTFEYKKLRSRLQAVHDALSQEIESWIKAGANAAAKESTATLEFRNKLQAVKKKLKQEDRPVDLDTIDNNPFVWQLILFGNPMTNLDGGIFKIRLVFSSKFPEVQPRVNVVTPLFHQRVSPDGVLCYFPKNEAEPSSHIDAIVAAIEEEEPAYDPRTRVNPEATGLLWGTPDDKKLYNRRLRKSAQKSSEYL